MEKCTTEATLKAASTNPDTGQLAYKLYNIVNINHNRFDWRIATLKRFVKNFLRDKTKHKKNTTFPR